MPKDIIIIIIIINIIIIIKALTGTKGLEPKAEECQAGTAAEGTDSPILWETSRGSCCPSLPGWNHRSPGSAFRGCWPCPVAGRTIQLCLLGTLPSLPDPKRSWAQLLPGRAGSRLDEHPGIPRSQPGCTGTGILQLPWNQLCGPKNAPREADIQHNSSTNPWKIKTWMCLQSGPQSHRSRLRVLAGGGIDP